MNATPAPSTDPRWGTQQRDLKAEQIILTLQHFAGSDLADKDWLDFGCGCGEIAAHLAPRVQRMTGIDPEPWQRWDLLTATHPNLCFIQASVETLKLPDANVDIIICNQVYEHVPDPQALIRKIHALLKPGGMAYFAGPNLLFPIEPHVFWPFVHWLPRTWAQRLMKALGSKRVADLDAYSTHYWQLRSWLTPGFKVTNATPHLMRGVLPSLKTGLIYQLMRHAPQPLLRAITPLLPGFVFILEKR